MYFFFNFILLYLYIIILNAQYLLKIHIYKYIYNKNSENKNNKYSFNINDIMTQQASFFTEIFMGRKRLYILKNVLMKLLYKKENLVIKFNLG